MTSYGVRKKTVGIIYDICIIDNYTIKYQNMSYLCKWKSVT